jgi:heme-degrading monooxygenase HmoA
MILFQLYFEVAADKTEEFESTFAEVFLPALSRQQGFKHCKLLRTFAPSVSAEIEARTDEFNYQANFVFESEQLRRNWAKSADHDVAWPAMEKLCKKVGWRGYDLLVDTLSG